MAAPGAVAIVVAFSTATSFATPAGKVEPTLQMPRLAIHAPATVPAAASPQLKRDDLIRKGPVEDVDVTGPVN